MGLGGPGVYERMVAASGAIVAQIAKACRLQMSVIWPDSTAVTVSWYRLCPWMVAMTSSLPAISYPPPVTTLPPVHDALDTSGHFGTFVSWRRGCQALAGSQWHGSGRRRRWRRSSPVITGADDATPEPGGPGRVWMTAPTDSRRIVGRVRVKMSGGARRGRDLHRGSLDPPDRGVRRPAPGRRDRVGRRRPPLSGLAPQSAVRRGGAGAVAGRGLHPLRGAR